MLLHQQKTKIKTKHPYNDLTTLQALLVAERHNHKMECNTTTYLAVSKHSAVVEPSKSLQSMFMGGEIDKSIAQRLGYTFLIRPVHVPHHPALQHGDKGS